MLKITLHFEIVTNIAETAFEKVGILRKAEYHYIYQFLTLKYRILNKIILGRISQLAKKHYLNKFHFSEKRRKNIAHGFNALYSPIKTSTIA